MEEFSNEAFRQELRALRARYLDGASFEEQEEIVTKLGIEVHPAEDPARCGIVSHAPPTKFKLTFPNARNACAIALTR